MTMNLTIGNIGTGKSILARKLVLAGCVRANMDSITSMIGGGEYGLYDKNKTDVYHSAENSIIEKALKNGFSVVIDRTNMDIERRKRFIEIGKKYAKEIIAYDFGAGDDNSLNRKLKNPIGIPKATWKSVFEFMQKSYEKPSYDEGFDKIIIAPEKYKFYAFDFDGTIVENKFPEIGEIIEGTVNKINKLFHELLNIIIVWSCRSGDHENCMRQFLLKNKIPFDFINENPMVDFGSPKIFAHEYYDDRSWRIM